jgi:hypothetical protein
MMKEPCRACNEAEKILNDPPREDLSEEYLRITNIRLALLAHRAEVEELLRRLELRAPGAAPRTLT